MHDFNEQLPTTEIHQRVDEIGKTILEGAREFALDNGTICPEQVVAQIIMDTLGNPDGLDMATKQRLVVMAGHMGPDYAQALYHAAVFITRVA
jgi:hypothetical protein